MAEKNTQHFVCIFTSLNSYNMHYVSKMISPAT